jgi:hypothetical protein
MSGIGGSGNDDDDEGSDFPGPEDEKSLEEIQRKIYYLTSNKRYKSGNNSNNSNNRNERDEEEEEEEKGEEED